VRARYLVAADGSRSPIREQLGIQLRGHPPFAQCLTIYFRADVMPLLRDRVLSVVYVFNDDVQGFFRFEIAGDAGFLAVNAARDAKGERTSDVAADQSEARCVGLVRTGLGVPDLPVEIENVQPWIASAEWAERFSDGRIFLAGDAAHAMPPTGGFGGNTGVHDADNLAWKLAAVLSGTAGSELLATYDAERRPVGEFTAEQAYTRWVVRLAPELGKEGLAPFVPDAPIELGYRYRSDAIVGEEGDDGALYENPHEPSGSPGTRVPHLTLERKGSPLSTLDLANPGFALLAGAAGEKWCRAATTAGAELGVRLDAYRVGACSCVPTGSSPGAREPPPTPAPGWSGRSPPSSPDRRARRERADGSAPTLYDFGDDRVRRRGEGGRGKRAEKGRSTWPRLATSGRRRPRIGRRAR
jgi:hypothetical protein